MANDYQKPIEIGTYLANTILCMIGQIWGESSDKAYAAILKIIKVLETEARRRRECIKAPIKRSRASSAVNDYSYHIEVVETDL